MERNQTRFSRDKNSRTTKLLVTIIAITVLFLAVAIMLIVGMNKLDFVNY